MTIYRTSPPPPRRGLAGRPILTVTIAVAALVSAGLGSVAWANRGHREPSASPPPAASAPSGVPSAPGGRAGSISLSATGDIIMGQAPGRLPAGDGRGFFDGVERVLAADLVMGNLEQTLTEDTGFRKCGAGSGRCFAFRTPPSYAAHLKAAGFDLLNQANNHGGDFGDAGFANTRKALEAHDLRHTGAEGEINVVDVRGVRVAVVGFAPYERFNDLRDLAASRAVVRRAAGQADLVVVQVHMGAEGADYTHVRPGSEFLGSENRGDPIAFAHAVVDAGADLVVGHGPHVLRAMEFYKGRLIAYSLGNFSSGPAPLKSDGVLGRGGVLTVSLAPDGKWTGGTFHPTMINSAGRPVPDRAGRGRDAVAGLSAEDFPSSGARVARDGTITPPS
ncbi:CapA family protein [Actinoplanes sp. NPDC051475]|uniref:CapA family protein n=1 Tax=Actinoplanes sp. NPDC051475 TaxID=3157225 RepID=UPI00344D7612